MVTNFDTNITLQKMNLDSSAVSDICFKKKIIFWTYSMHKKIHINVIQKNTDYENRYSISGVLFTKYVFQLFLKIYHIYKMY